jgi:DNA gyrase subunit B
LKDDDALDNFMIQAALDDAHLYVNSNAPSITGPAFEALISEFRSVKSLINRISRLYPQDVLNQMIYSAELSEDMLSDHDIVNEWTRNLVESIDVNKSTASHFESGVVADEERNLFLPQVNIVAHGVPHTYVFGYDFFLSAEYRAMIQLGKKLTGLLEMGAYVRKGERIKPIENFDEVLNWLLTQAKRGYYIQRYKGLGEMNPDQLWETTMDPDQRRMLRVTIEDAIAADQMFTTLMGDEVEPRRAFIESNALSVTNLDI